MSSRTDFVLITGCGSGIGHALALAFHEAGWPVCATARRLDSLAALQARGILVKALDVTDRSAIAALVQDFQQQGHWVSTLVNNAGYGAMGALTDVPDQEWQRQFDVNVFAPMALVRAFFPAMREHGRGQIVNISSVSGVMPTPFAGPYCASKAAMNAIGDSLRMELAPFGIQVVTVQPGGIQTAFGDQASARVSLPPDSAYLPIRDGILARANESQSQAMPASQFAQALVHLLSQPQPPALIRLGSKSRLMPGLKRWLPQRWLDQALSRRFGLDRLPRKSTT